MKQTGLKADPAKVREWQERSRKPLAQDPAKALKRGAPLRAVSERDTEGREGMRSSTLRRAGFNEARSVIPPAQRKSNRSGPPTTLQEALTAEFKAKRPARAQTCVRCPQSRPKPATSWHHWVPQEHMRVMMRGLARVASWDPPEVARRLRAWLRDERNLSPLCTSCHMAGEAAPRPPRNAILVGYEPPGATSFAREEVPESSWLFAQELDDELEAAGRPREATARLLRNYA